MAPKYVVRKAGRLEERGSTGLQRFGGVVREEWLRELQGVRGRRVLREMADNDPTVGAILFAVEMTLRGVDWRVEPFSDDPRDVERADFVSSLSDDMSMTWEDLVAEAMTMLVYGWSGFEVVYKTRGGPDARDPRRRSKHTDGLVGWRKIAPRAQETLDRWEFGDDGGLEGLWQRQVAGASVFIPVEKLLVFKTTSRKSNPGGRSVLRNAFLPWYRKRRVEEAEAIGVERDLAGLPVFYVDPSLFDDEPTTSQQQQLAAYQDAVENIKNDEQGGLVLPSVYDESGNQIVRFELASTGGRRAYDTTKIADRYDRQIAQTVLADFVMLGHEKVGSYSLSSDKTDMFARVLGAWLKEIASVLNRHALPRLFRLNGWSPAEVPEFVPGDLETPEVEKFSEAMSALAGAGFLTPGDRETEALVRERLDLPEPPEDDEFRPPPPTSNTPPPGSPPGPEEDDL